MKKKLLYPLISYIRDSAGVLYEKGGILVNDTLFRWPKLFPHGPACSEFINRVAESIDLDIRDTLRERGFEEDGREATALYGKEIK